MTRNTETNSSSKTWLGIVLVLIGTYFLLDNLHLIPSFIPYWVFGWESILVIIGGAMLITGRREGLIFLGIGVFFLLPDLFHIPRFHFRDWWPVILILIGISIFLRTRNNSYSQVEGNDEFFNDTSIFGGTEKTITSNNLKGGRVTSLFGGSSLNLINATLGQKDVMLDYLCIFGGNEIIVPNDWTVINEATVIFGGFTDDRGKISGTKPDSEKILRIKGLVMFGGCEVRGG